MARWEPDARGRLLRAALELFAERGYDATTAAAIAERAGLTKTTLFRQFADKREILFQGQADSVRVADSAVRAAPAGASALEALREALAALCDGHTPDHRDTGRRIAPIVATSPELQERAGAKRASIAAALQGALADRTGDVDVAGALADLGVRAYYGGFDEWVVGDEDVPLREVVLTRLDRLVAGVGGALAPSAGRRR
ncbi:TetR/AcrR family transcriptional regulator [Lapillicoccus jejuensis]|uniref:TetR family transcriptional regulator n=1 Tax=Lapillicoccus jejuensis TaxID=402171 RepID=A0A542E116_9MICO|nr:TetR/AcrR family transcriptional regulator [Lapillicoccus jejuensis]TQJ09026.1 TetR family transcriptional regulator [Lapillicoccus jejuensis]